MLFATYTQEVIGVAIVVYFPLTSNIPIDRYYVYFALVIFLQ